MLRITELRLPLNHAEDALRPAILQIHGGGYILGSVEVSDLRNRTLALETDCVVAAVDYRLAPEHPFPAALDDAMVVLEWAADNGSELHIDTSRLANLATT